MADEKPKTTNAPVLERHIQTALLAVAIALVMWVGNKIMAISDQQIAMSTAVDHMTRGIQQVNADIASVRTDMREFYLRSEAERTNADIYSWLRRHDERLIKLEREVGK